jgi:hypothetical protein
MQRSRQEHKTGVQNAHDVDDLVQQVTNYPNYRSERIYMYSNDKKDGTYGQALYENDNSIVKRGVSGLGIEEVHLNYCIPNVNGRNNIISFQLDGGGVSTATITIKNYETTLFLFTEIVAKMNGAVIPDPFSFSINDDCTVDLISTTDFKFLNCPFINFGESLHGLYYTSGFVPLIKAVAHLQYTSFIDIVVSDMTNAQLAQSTYSIEQKFNTIAHIARVHVDEEISIPRKIVKKYDTKINYFPFRHRSLNSVNIQLVDEFNNTLYSQVFESGSGETIELQNLKYSLILNAVF